VHEFFDAAPQLDARQRVESGERIVVLHTEQPAAGRQPCVTQKRLHSTPKTVPLDRWAHFA